MNYKKITQTQNVFLMIYHLCEIICKASQKNHKIGIRQSVVKGQKYLRKRLKIPQKTVSPIH